jgi:preprotein translocase subunit SecA
MFKNIARALGGDSQKRGLARLMAEIEPINQLESAFEGLSIEDLRAKTEEFRRRLGDGEILDDILPEAFAAVREASKRTTGLRHYDVQLIGGMVLHNGKIAEMRTGEGKTLVATLPLYLNALSGKGAHLVTVNDYLARRDARWMAPIYDLLGLSVGVLQMASRTDNAQSAFLVDLASRDAREEMDQLRLVPRVRAYAADITYGTNNEFGFDFLRDNLVMDMASRVQRGHHYAIIDEVDNILIDEARTPLIISGPASEDVEWYSRMARLVKQLDPEDYEFDEKDRSIALTEIGETHVEDLLKIPLRDPDRPEDITPEQARLLGYLEQALRAQLLYNKNKDYIVQNGQVIIVDEFTGRLMPGRRWSEGLHQAVEAKEGVKVNPENITHATITLQNYFRKYAKLAGMTGTAMTEAEEFDTIYKLGVVEIPTNLDYEAGRPEAELVILQGKDEEGYTATYYAAKNEPERKALFWKRKDYPDVVYRTEEAKLRAITLEILELHVIGRPQLVGTTSIDHSERLSARLRAEPLRRLLTAELLRDAYYEQQGISQVDRQLLDLVFLNAPLAELKTDEMRRFAQDLPLDGLNPESPENFSRLLRMLELDPAHGDRLQAAIQGGIPHEVLNALRHDQESQIIAGAGAFGAVTIATNMAGRGVDIKLGGEIQEHILAEVRRVLSAAGRDPYGMTSTDMADALRQLDAGQLEDAAEAAGSFLNFLDDMGRVRQVGGLHVVGSERHEARRIDNQLRGRAARQGDPGSSRFYLSLEDDLMRMFGGERAENLMRIFNIDPSIPLESNMLGRLVEQAQERVEGSNFDVRKHLLEYDDVLNDQRERIYGERDRVLVKKDLEEDVLELLRSELQRRIPEALKDEDGPWKLLSFLEEIQPSISYSAQGERLQSYPLRVTAGLLAGLINDPRDPESVRAGSLDLARRALEAERGHLVSQTSQFIQRSMESYNTQLAERLELLDIFMDNLESYQGLTARELGDELQNLVRVKISLGAELARALQEYERGARQKLEEQIEDQMMGVFLSRMLMAIERRAGARLALDTEALAGQDWAAIETAILDAVSRSADERIEALDQPSGQVRYNIDAFLKSSAEQGVDTPDLAELAAAMALGTQTGIDASTHQRVSRRVNILNYIHLAAGSLAGRLPEEISADILAHLESVQRQLRVIWGKMELQRLALDGASFGDLPDEYQQSISQQFSAPALETLSNRGFQALLDEGNREAISAFGRGIQTVIYRHILLRSISDLWIEHLTQMEGLRVSIRMEAYAQRDPLVEYKSLSTDRFKDLMGAIRMGVISKMFRLQPAAPQPPLPEAPPAPEGTPVKQTEPAAGSKKRKRHKKR